MLLNKDFKDICELLSQKELKEIHKEMPSVIQGLKQMEFVKKHPSIKELYGEKTEAPLENWSLVLTYFSAAKMAKHSKHLTGLTIGLLVATLLLLASAVIQLVTTICGSG